MKLLHILWTRDRRSIPDKCHHRAIWCIFLATPLKKYWCCTKSRIHYKKKKFFTAVNKIENSYFVLLGLDGEREKVKIIYWLLDFKKQRHQESLLQKLWSMILPIHFSAFAVIVILRGLGANSASTTHLWEFMTREVCNSGGSYFCLFVCLFK